MLLDESALPHDLLVDSVLSYLDLYSLIKFSGTSKTCQKIIYNDIPKKRWAKINFNGNQNITDDQLHAFLDNINANQNTKVLSLVGCTKITGSGLVPLSGSSVLEDIDLRVLGSLPLQGDSACLLGSTGLDEECVGAILNSMLPNKGWWNDGDLEQCSSVAVREPCGCDTPVKQPQRRIALRRVSIRPCAITLGAAVPIGRGTYAPNLQQFFRHHKFLTDREPWAQNPNSCYVCFVHACDENESISCEQCNRHFCNACAMPPSCSECTKLRCQWCTNVVSCGRCNKQSCASHGYESCGGCDKVYCVDCHDELENCLVCNEYYCSEACHQGAHH